MDLIFIFAQNTHKRIFDLFCVEELVFVGIELYQGFEHIPSYFVSQVKILELEFTKYGGLYV